MQQHAAVISSFSHNICYRNYYTSEQPSCNNSTHQISESIYDTYHGWVLLIPQLCRQRVGTSCRAFSSFMQSSARQWQMASSSRSVLLHPNSGKRSSHPPPHVIPKEIHGSFFNSVVSSFPFVNHESMTLPWFTPVRQQQETNCHLSYVWGFSINHAPTSHTRPASQPGWN